MITCNTCKIEKPESEYYASALKRWYYACKVCSRIRSKKYSDVWNKKNKEWIAAYQKRNNQTKKRKEYMRQYMAEYYKKDPERLAKRRAAEQARYKKQKDEQDK